MLLPSVSPVMRRYLGKRYVLAPLAGYWFLLAFLKRNAFAVLFFSLFSAYIWHTTKDCGRRYNIGVVIPLTFVWIRFGKAKIDKGATTPQK